MTRTTEASAALDSLVPAPALPFSVTPTIASNIPLAPGRFFEAPAREVETCESELFGSACVVVFVTGVCDVRAGVFDGVFP